MITGKRWEAGRHGSSDGIDERSIKGVKGEKEFGWDIREGK